MREARVEKHLVDMVKDAGGKVMKPPTYSPADMSRFVIIIEHEEDSHAG